MIRPYPLIPILLLFLMVDSFACASKVREKKGDVTGPLKVFSEQVTPTDEQIHLGKLLFFDRRLSLDGTMACASCHQPKLGWTDQIPLARGVQGRIGKRNTPSLVNVKSQALLFRDGRSSSLEQQAFGPLTHPDEMGQVSPEAVVTIVKNIPGYAPLFKNAYGDEAINAPRIADALASFERTLIGNNSRFDDYQAGNHAALSPSEIRGMHLFFGQANCIRCHVGSRLSDSDFHNLGVGMGQAQPDLGRYLITQIEENKGAFLTPNLRDVTRSAPYMHDGSLATLAAVIDFYNEGGKTNPWLSPRITPLHLTAQNKADLLDFLQTLDSRPYPQVVEPVLLP